MWGAARACPVGYGVVWMASDDMTPLQQWQRLAMARRAGRASHAREAENKRAQRNWQGLDNDKPVTLREIRPVAKARPEEPQSAKAFRKHIQRLHLDGFVPDAIAARLACPEALIGKYLRVLYQEGRNLSDDYRQLRVVRIYALKQQGMALPDIAKLMGVNTVLLNKDMREMPQERARTAQGRRNTGRI